MSVAAQVTEPVAPPVAMTGRLVLNFVAFQVGWFACVLAAANSHAWLGTGIAAAIVALHVARAPQPAAEAKLIAVAIAIGAVFDSVLVAAGWVEYSSGTIVSSAAPHWILALWALFAMTLNLSLRWLHGRFVVAAVLGAICGPLSYWGGVGLGALSFTEPVPALLALGLGWSMLMPALAAIARRYDGEKARS